MAMIRFASLPLLCFIFCPVWLFGMDLSCPSEFKEGENLVSCKINKTAVSNGDCSYVQSYVTFELTSGFHSVPMCYTPSFNSSNCHPVLEPVKNTCWCNGTTNEIFDYNFVFTANQSRDQGALLECKICFLPSKCFKNKADDSCKNLSFGSPVIDQGWTSEHTSTLAMSFTPLIVTIIIITIIIIVVFRRRCHSQRCILRFPALLQLTESKHTTI